MVKLAQRMGRIEESATIRVTRLARERRERGLPVFDLSAGEPDFPSPAVATEAAERALREGLTRYTATAGLADLRAELAHGYRRLWGAPWDSTNAIVTVGGKGALFQLALALFESGDRVILPSPAWVSFAEQIRLAGAEPVFVPMSAEGGFRLEAAPLLDRLDSRVRAVIVNSPCNPTGAVMSAEELGLLVAGCAERGVTVISDETYDRFVWLGERTSAARFATDHPETVVVVSSFSKSYAMTGWRVGFALGPRSLTEALQALQSHSVTHATSFAMAGALAALRGAEAEVESNLAEYRARRELVVSRLEQIEGVRCPPPAGTFYAFPDVGLWCDRLGVDSVGLAERLLESTGVAVVPGAAFGSDRHLRLSFAAAPEVLETALDRLSEAVSGGLERAGTLDG